jgi:hypothetical protein
VPFSVYCDPETGWIEIRGLAVSEDGRYVGKMCRIIKPGEAYVGYSHEKLWALGTGTHDLPPLPKPGQESPPTETPIPNTPTESI